MKSAGEITRMPAGMKGGDEKCRSQFIAAAYGELKRIAARQLAGESVGHTLQPSALVHEPYLRMLAREGADGWTSIS